MSKEEFAGEIIPYVELVDNTNERTPCVLVLDCSGSMEGEPIRKLNDGLKQLEKELKDDIDASSRVQILIVKAFGMDQAEVATDWTDAMNFSAPTMNASGLTPLGKAMDLALQKIQEQKARYDSNGITSKRPWIFLISDGEPTDYSWEESARKCREAAQNKKAIIYSIGVGGANFDKLALFSTIEPKRLDGIKFKEFFLWLSRSVTSVSKSAPGQVVQLSATDSWSAVEL